MKKNNSFLNGLLIGIMIACIIATIGNIIGVNYISKHYEKLLKEATQFSKDGDAEEANTKLDAIYSLVSKYYLEEHNKDDMKEGIYKGFLSALNDPYSGYFTPEEYADLKEDSSGIYCGIGVQVSQNVTTKVITVTKVFKDCPGEKAGILPGDVVTKVAGTDVTDMDISKAVELIKGEEGSFVEIEVYRESTGQSHTLKAERKKVEAPTVEYELLDGNIGYIELSGFDEVTAKQFKKALDELKKQGIKGLIVDVRNNPGGLLAAVNEILENLLPEGIIVYTEDKNGKKVTYNCDGKNEIDIPMAVLINGSSASASEIFAGALKDYDKAELVGTTTFGKGIVQTLIPLVDGSAVKLTVSKYYTPSGVNIHGTGVKPDVEIDLDKELKSLVTIPKDKDNQLQKAIEVLKEKMK